MANSIIKSVASNIIDKVSGTPSRTTLQDFLNGISKAHSNGIKIREIDPLNSFDVYFKFYPCNDISLEKKKGVLQEVGKGVVNGLKTATKNALNNLTGGLLGSLKNNVDIIKEHNKFTTIRSDSESHTFLEYLAKANLLCGTESTWFGGMGEITSPLEIDMTYFTQSITLPHLQNNSGDGQDVEYIGSFKLNGTFTGPDSKQLTMNIINTKAPVLERIFYPWLKEVTLPYWSYSTQPFTTATITIDLTKHSDLKYTFTGCRPQKITSYQPSQELPSELTRAVTFDFDYMFVYSDLTTTEPINRKLGSMAKTLVNSGLNSLRL